MNLLIAGGRNFNNQKLLTNSLVKLVLDGAIEDDSTLICGMAKGADILAYNLWVSMNLPIQKYYADWNTNGKKAGYLRNIDMGNIADVAVIFWDGKSKGTAHMIDIMQKLSKPAYVFCY